MQKLKANLAGRMTKPAAFKRVFFALIIMLRDSNRRLLIANVRKIFGDRDFSFRVHINRLQCALEFLRDVDIDRKFPG